MEHVLPIRLRRRRRHLVRVSRRTAIAALLILALAAGGGLLLAGRSHSASPPAPKPVTVWGTAPGPLRAMVAKVYKGTHGLTVQMKNGLLAYFGDRSRLQSKWDSLAAVLADPASAGAIYVDVRLPERPAAGMGAEGGGLGSEAAAESAQVSATDPSSAALAESLARAVNGEPPIEPAATEPGG